MRQRIIRSQQLRNVSKRHSPPPLLLISLLRLANLPRLDSLELGQLSEDLLYNRRR